LKICPALIQRNGSYRGIVRKGEKEPRGFHLGKRTMKGKEYQGDRRGDWKKEEKRGRATKEGQSVFGTKNTQAKGDRMSSRKQKS